MYQDRTFEEAEQLLVQLAQHSPDVIWMFSPDWSNLKFVDPAYEDVWSRSIRTLADDPTDFLNGIHPADRKTVKKKMEQLTNEEAIEFEFRVNADEEYQRHVWAKGRPVYDEDGEFAAVVGFVRDITDRKQYKQELERKNERLERFISVLSHDLRNPLNVAMGRLNLAREECESEHLADIDHALTRVEMLIEDLLQLAQEGESIETLQTVDITTITERCWNNVETNEATLITDGEQAIQANPGRLQQLLENLIRNAVEHCRTDVTVTVGGMEDGFYVADDGPGISEGRREQVFEMGYSDAVDGTGLG